MAPVVWIGVCGRQRISVCGCEEWTCLEERKHCSGREDFGKLELHQVGVDGVGVVDGHCGEGLSSGIAELLMHGFDSPISKYGHEVDIA